MGAPVATDTRRGAAKQTTTQLWTRTSGDRAGHFGDVWASAGGADPVADQTWSHDMETCQALCNKARRPNKTVDRGDHLAHIKASDGRFKRKHRITSSVIRRTLELRQPKRGNDRSAVWQTGSNCRLTVTGPAGGRPAVASEEKGAAAEREQRFSLGLL